MGNHAILIVDDERGVIEALRRVFIDEPYTVHTAESAAEALTLLEKHPIKVIISDERMPVVSGSEFLSMVHARFPSTIRIMLTGHASLDAAMRAINQGEIYRFFRKPWENLELLFTVRGAIEKYDLEEENRRLIETVKRQALNIKLIERQFPGITQLEYDHTGRIVVDDVPDDELDRLIAECERNML